jgi:carbonic anhydrase
LTSKTRTDNDLSVNKLRWNYVPSNTKCLLNPGYCWRVDIKGAGSELTGGPLNDDIYVVEQFHCHWGCSNGRGSEHTVDGQAYSGELHIVHWNSSKYNSFKEAAGHPDGLAVLGVFMKVGKAHEELDIIAKLMPFISHKGDRVTIDRLDPGKFVPENKAYWTYEGSLTSKFKLKLILSRFF